MFAILKIGGSVLCNRDIPFSVKWDNLERVAEEIRRAMDYYLERGEELKLILIHGGGSFGHPVARKYMKKGRFENMERGFWEIQKAMRRFNTLVIDALQDYGIPGVSIQPSSFVAFREEGIHFDTYVIEGMLKRGLVPVIHGDVVISEREGYRIFSGDHALPYLTKRLKPDISLHASDVDGVLDGEGEVIRSINSENIKEVVKYLKSSKKEDVTGGMYLKVMEAYKMGVKVLIFNGSRRGNIYRGLIGDESIGTRIN
ncbi:isopentenyl phosphate kinase family protein [Methanothermococcus sp. SCGC AD-155-E23]|nr:isopentenyl phosphate kinase family protein [Methanothermococcus sp. SCGC AD-155-E23]